MRTPSVPVPPRTMAAITLVLLVALATLAYWPGLYGDFLFDDFANLPALGRYGGVQDLTSLVWYLTSGIADPTGRPVAMLSFLIDARDWPAAPFPFKRTNLAIHLCNGLLLYSTLAALGRRTTPNHQHACLAALIATALWLLHPLWVSTVLYVVQRHAMLATFFVLAGLRSWIASRDAFDAGRVRHGWIWAVAAVPAFGLLAGLSKANGFLLPLLLVVLQASVLRQAGATHGQARVANAVFIWLPGLLVIAWLIHHGFHAALAESSNRPWTWEQRLLSQPRALCHYLWQLFVPGLDATGVFADGFAASRDWRTPWTTLPALFAVALMAGAAWMLRQRTPVLAAALGFFLVGHVMESSVVMLELYFEHRNYLPALLLFWPLAWWVSAPGRFRRWLLAGAISYVVVMPLATALQARLWGDPLMLALVWAEQNPHSARAQAHAFHYERASGRQEAAEQRLATLMDRNPHEPQFALNLLDLHCEHGRVANVDIERAATAIRASRGLALDVNYHWLSAALLPDSGSACSILPDAQLSLLLKVATDEASNLGRDSPELNARKQLLFANYALRQHDCSAALMRFDNRISAQPRPEFMQTQVNLLATRCTPDHGLAHLMRYREAGAPITPASSPMLRFRDHLMREWWDAHWDSLQRTLEEDAANSHAQKLDMSNG